MRELTEVVPFVILGAKFSIAVAFCMIFFTTVSYFRTEYLGLVFGAMNFAGRMSTIAAPMIAEQDEPAPTMSCIVLCVLATFGSFWLRRPRELRELVSGVDEDDEKEIKD